jgi:LytR cell envelope-related transcriptional attenuator/LytR_cpsA_psr family
MTGKRRAGRPAASPTPSTPSGPSTPPARSNDAIVIAPRKTRRELRAERRRQRRRRLGGAGLAAVVVGGIVAAAAIGFGVNTVTSSSGPPPRTQTTLLLSLVLAGKSASVSALLAHDPKAMGGVEILVPSRLITDVCGYGSQRFGDITTLPGGQQLARAAMSQVLGGVTVDSEWMLTTGQLAALVNAVGGVTVTVDTDVIARSAGGGGTLVVPKGTQHLDGAHAVDFATYIAPGEDSTANLSRFQSVFQAMVDALPVTTAQLAQVLSSTGGTAGVGTGPLAGLLAGLAADDKAKSLLPIDLPTQAIDSGGSQPAYRIDPAATRQLVEAQLGASLPAAARQGRSTVLVQNGVGTPGLVETACSRLTTGGFAIAGSGNADHFGYVKSQVIVFDSTVAAAELGDRVARLLGLPTGDVLASTQGQNVADVVVILGRDYRR